MSDNMGHIIAPLVCESVNVHDTRLFPDSLSDLLDFSHYCGLDVFTSFFTLDSGFDSRYNRDLITDGGMVPVIKPNLRGLKDRIKRYKRLDDFERYTGIYQQRYVIERCFAWEGTYRKLVIRYERLQSVFMGFRYLAFSLINFRGFLENPR